MSLPPLSLGQCATFACLLEVTAPKVGNVHRGADFEDLKFTDFAASAAALGPVIEHAVERGVGETVLRAIEATRRVTDSNTNLGTVLLLAPLAVVPRDQSLREGLAPVLGQLNSSDAELVYRAIHLVQPGGLGQVDEMDVRDAPPKDLLLAMQAAADRDLIARQYVTGFAVVLHFVVPELLGARSDGVSLTEAILHTQLRLMSEFPDSLIARKCGEQTARQSAARAARALDAGPAGSPERLRAMAELDFWLRSDGHRRNPGTTADLIAAGLFAALRDNRLAPPFD